MKKEDLKATWFVILIVIQVIAVICVLRGLGSEDKQDNIIISKYRQYGKVIAEIKVDAKECNAAEK